MDPSHLRNPFGSSVLAGTVGTGVGEAFPDKWIPSALCSLVYPWRELPNTIFLPCLDTASSSVAEKPPATQPSLTFTLPAAGTAASPATLPAPGSSPLLESLKKMQSCAGLSSAPGEWESPRPRSIEGPRFPSK